MLISEDSLGELDAYYMDVSKKSKQELSELSKLSEFNVRHSSDFYEIEGNSITGGNFVRIPASRYSTLTID